MDERKCETCSRISFRPWSTSSRVRAWWAGEEGQMETDDYEISYCENPLSPFYDQPPPPDKSCEEWTP